ncbi:MAG: CCA tRNA nucleotidyltransferase, partial [Alphaproteobacteria bacterium]
LLRILDAPHPADTIVLMNGERVLEHCLPEAVDFGRLRMMAWLETTAIKIESVTPDPLRRLASLLETEPQGHAALGRRLRLSNKQVARLGVMTGEDVSPIPETTDTDLRATLHRLGADAVRDRALLAWAGEMSINPRRPSERTDAWLGVLEAIDGWTDQTFPIQGNDVLELGLDPGSRVGDLLGEVEAWWRGGDFRADREACLERLKEVVFDADGHG